MGIRLVIRAADGKPLDEELAYPFQQDRIAIGRGAGVDVRIPHRTVSTLHATVRAQGQGHVVEDCNSTNGTFVNGDRLVPQRARKLADGDRLRIGAYELSFHASPLLSEAMTVERTAELARRLLQGQLGVVAPRLVVLDGPGSGHTLSLAAPPSSLRVGRAESCQLVLDDPDVSREHLEIERDLQGVWAVNLESKNGVLLHGQPFSRRRLRDADELLLGHTRVLFEDPAEESMQALTEEPDLVWSAPPAETGTPLAPPQPPVTPEPAAAAPAPRSGTPDADWIIYAMAAVVLTLSGLGLFLLMGR